MTDPDLRELLHDHVRDVTGPDLADRAWERARGLRRRRAGTAAVATAVVAVLAGSALWSPTADRTSDPVAPSPAPSRTSAAPTPYAGDGGRAPDARDGRWPVFWGPSAEQEATLPAVDSPLPTTIDLAATATPLEDDPVESALAAYAVTRADGSRGVLVLAEDGSLREVDVSRVQPLVVDGTDVSVARETLLSPTGRYLSFPQDGSVAVLTLGTATWRTVDTGAAPTAHAGWLGDSDLYLPPDRSGGRGPMYDVVEGARTGSNGVLVPRGPVDDGSTVGRYRQGPLGTAQVWSTSGVSVPRGNRTASRVLVVDGNANTDSVLVLGETDDARRSDACCSVTFWLDSERIVYESTGTPRRLVVWRVGTHELGLVATVHGIPAGASVVSSYVRVWS